MTIGSYKNIHLENCILVMAILIYNIILKTISIKDEPGHFVRQDLRQDCFTFLLRSALEIFCSHFDDSTFLNVQLHLFFNFEHEYVLLQEDVIFLG